MDVSRRWAEIICKLHAEYTKPFQNKRSRLSQPTNSSAGVAYLSNVSPEFDNSNTDDWAHWGLCLWLRSLRHLLHKHCDICFSLCQIACWFNNKMSNMLTGLKLRLNRMKSIIFELLPDLHLCESNSTNMFSLIPTKFIYQTDKRPRSCMNMFKLNSRW